MNEPAQYSIILFYRYSRVENLANVVNKLKSLCEKGILGRILVATEGVNGTLAGSSENIRTLINFIEADDHLGPIFYNMDWKQSSGFGRIPFNDLHIRESKELISCGAMKDFINQQVDFDASFGGLSGGGIHLSPKEFHDAIQRDDKDTVVVDVRNGFEYDIGHFKKAKKLNTNTYAESWQALDELQIEDKSKNVYMYCTGGIRCEKASAYMRGKGYQHVFQLRGGIHKYLEEFSGRPDRLFLGKEFVFDARVSMMTGAQASKTHESFRFLAKSEEEMHQEQQLQSDIVVGRCIECQQPHDAYSGLVVCTVCRMPVLVCPSCVDNNPHLGEYHCTKHRNLKDVYFTVLDRFDHDELRKQVAALELMEKSLDGKKQRHRRNTLRKQREKIAMHLKNDSLEILDNEISSHADDTKELLLQNPKQHFGQAHFFWQA